LPVRSLTQHDKLAKTGKSAKTGKLDDLRDKTSHEIERQRGKEAKRQRGKEAKHQPDEQVNGPDDLQCAASLIVGLL